MNNIQVANRLQEQLQTFSGIFYPRFSKPKSKFITEMIYGIQASQDVKLSAIGRALGEDIELKKTEERLSHHLKQEGFGQKIQEIIAEQAARRVHKDTLIVVDPTDIRKTYAKHMPYLAHVRDGSSGEIVPGYWACLAVACEVESRRVIPMHQILWSCEAPDFVSENAQILGVIDTVSEATKGRGIFVIDRGGDRNKLYGPLLDKGLRFIIRLVGERDLMYRGAQRNAMEIGKECPMNYAQTVVREVPGGEKRFHLEYGCRSVKLPGRKEELTLIVVRGFGEEPMLLLTNVQVLGSRKSQWFIVQGYLARWLIEETIRFIKQSYRMEDIRVLNYERLRNLIALVLAAAYFSGVWLGESLKLAVLATRVTQVAKRFFGVPDFHYYALADGISVLFSKIGRWLPGLKSNPQVTSPYQTLLFQEP